MKTIITKTTEIILTSVEELKNLPDGTGVQAGYYYKERGFDYSYEEGYYIKDADGLCDPDDSFYDMTWKDVAISLVFRKVYRVSQTVEVISVDGE